MSHRDPAYLPTLQIDAIAEFLEAVGQAVGTDGVVRIPESEPKDLPVELDGSGDELLPDFDGEIEREAGPEQGEAEPEPAEAAPKVARKSRKAASR